ncbi:MAG: hypothetical protein EOO65_00295 [Methanosarcinales archaeon]|nr:MAG: hypothetical protein EOO65_00295 [Methanosarcinales archaeon]
MEQLQIAARWKIHEGKIDEFKKLATECHSHVVKKIPNRLQFSWFINDEQSECIVMELYPDSNAFLMHLSVVSEYLGKMMTIADLSAEIFGNPSPELLKATEGVKKTIYYFYQGLEAPVNKTTVSLS